MLDLSAHLRFVYSILFIIQPIKYSVPCFWVAAVCRLSWIFDTDDYAGYNPEAAQASVERLAFLAHTQHGNVIRAVSNKAYRSSRKLHNWLAKPSLGNRTERLDQSRELPSRNWSRLVCSVEGLHLPTDNNATEPSIRLFVIGGKILTVFVRRFAVYGGKPSYNALSETGSNRHAPFAPPTSVYLNPEMQI